MSRPNSSVPNQCSAEGGRRRALRSCATGSYGASTGASTATATRHATSTRPTTAPRLRRKRLAAGDARMRRRGDAAVGPGAAAAGRSAIPHLRVQGRIREVDDQVHEYEQGGDEQHGALHERKVAALDRVDEEPPHAG